MSLYKIWLTPFCTVLVKPEGSSFSETSTCFHLNVGSKSLRFLLMGCKRTFTLFLNLELRKNYMQQYLHPRPQSIFCGTHDKVLFRLLWNNSSLSLCSFATSTCLTCSRSGQPQMVQRVSLLSPPLDRRVMNHSLEWMWPLWGSQAGTQGHLLMSFSTAVDFIKEVGSSSLPKASSSYSFSEL